MNQLNGVSKTESGIHVRCDLRYKEEGGILLFSKGEQVKKLPVSKENAVGDHYDICFDGLNTAEYDSYLLYEDKCVFPDPYSKKMIGLEEYGAAHSQVYSVLLQEDETFFSKKEERPQAPALSFSESIFYELHVRGFSKLAGYKEKGTFAGLIRKIPYLKELGVTTVILMPAYEFDETEENKTNYWGYKRAYYFAPKSSYAYSDDAVAEYKKMVDEFHENGMEVVMQMYFSERISPQYIREVLCFWTEEYLVDGFWLLGNRIPIAMLATEAKLANAKLLFCGFPMDEIQKYISKSYRNNLALINDSYMSNVRRFVKGDYNTAGEMVSNIKFYHEQLSRVSYITKHDTMSLFDSVMYEKKHNEANGEDNRDGSEYNETWNCGVEGVTRKKEVNTLREKQRKNMMTLLMLTSSAPMLYAGDECLHTQNGNNNPYCQDNEISWLSWKRNKNQKEWFDFVKQLIAFRKENQVFCGKRPFLMADRIGSGIPDLSVHSDEAWKAKLGHSDHSFGLMYCGAYEKNKTDVYVAYNMYWEEKQFALPAIKGKAWYSYLDTAVSTIRESEIIEGVVTCEPRSIRILVNKEV